MNSIFRLIKERGLSCTFKIFTQWLFLKDKNIHVFFNHSGANAYVQKYRYVLNRPAITDASCFENPYPNKIWTCWLQGITNAPEIVQQCVKSIVAQDKTGEVILLDNTNIAQYVEVPQHIAQKWRNGIISNTHYSDVIRLLLLEKYGGVWIDSTTFLLEKIPEYIREADIFCFKTSERGPSIASTGFIAAKAHNQIISTTKELLLEYWRKENKLVSYGLIHICFAMAVNSTEFTRKQWKNTPYFDCINNQLLQMELFDEYNPKRLEQIKQMSVIQKLSYKFPSENFEKKGTFYDEVVRKFEK
ncbi:hypothetical protein FACS189452_02760 [Bacteroidia bacterium]|nr:hypothetical protein FACS189452_02760 [Bacteroidia bacterium]